eukprot:CAMPEP_0185025478 /NCGR_PEP_ID=MMETSP1103-20130426/8416_1 /TAXON_ID=36769 /ORGANISM="Paraphysomonas bandaiensis, Strain Caron Lab Isolate" /LENGTH=316 /DNA_ID=CAMNT_0027558681 /DNA_START=249 /DNA_END=1199 /DNA_ORIENTATION=-
MEKLPEVEPMPLPELSVSNFSREELMRVSNGLRIPVVIRGALKDSAAVTKWSREYFLENYATESVVVREVIAGGDGSDESTMVVRVQGRTIEEYYKMMDKGRNVSMIASSSIFHRRPEFRGDMRAVMEDDLVGPNGEEIIALQFFATPGGRTYYHSEIGNNVFRQIVGQKRWTVISPEYNYLLCPKPVISGTSVNPDCLMQNTTHHQRDEHMKHIPRYTALLNPGDIFINAPWWWHDVLSIGDLSAPQISVAGRMKNLKATFLNSPMNTFVAVLTKVLSGEKHNDETFELDLEVNIIDSWRRWCEAQGRLDCITPV